MSLLLRRRLRRLCLALARHAYGSADRWIRLAEWILPTPPGGAPLDPPEV